MDFKGMTSLIFWRKTLAFQNFQASENCVYKRFICDKIYQKCCKTFFTFMKYNAKCYMVIHKQIKSTAFKFGSLIKKIMTAQGSAWCYSMLICLWNWHPICAPSVPDAPLPIQLSLWSGKATEEWPSPWEPVSTWETWKKPLAPSFSSFQLRPLWPFGN